MTDERMALSELLQKAGDDDFLRSVAETVLQMLMEADVEGTIGAGRHERSAERLNYRNSYRGRSLDTRLAGPTGGGKTTTLYASLLELNTPDRKILSIEDPVEYQLEGINQVQVKPQIGLSFANALRSFLRHDPDIMMIGEIRDLETAEIAVQAAG